MKCYNSVDQWKEDMEVFRNNPNDSQFLAHVAEKVRKSSQEVQDDIKDEVLDNMFVHDPYRLLLMLAENSGDKYPVIKSKEDIWFEA